MVNGNSLYGEVRSPPWSHVSEISWIIDNASSDWNQLMTKNKANSCYYDPDFLGGLSGHAFQ